MIGGKARFSRHTKRGAQQGSQRQHRGEYPAGRAGGKTQYRGDDAGDKHKQQQTHAEVPRRRNGDQPEAAARGIWLDKPEHATDSAKQAAHQHPFSRIPTVNTLEHILSAQDKGVKQRSHHAKNHAEDQVKPQGVNRRVGQFTHLNDRPFAIKEAKHDARHNDAGKHRFNGDQVVAKLRAHLFDDKQNARQRRVKGRR